MAMKEKKATKDSDPQASRRWITERRRRYYAGLGIPTQDNCDGEIIPTDDASKQMHERDLERARGLQSQVLREEQSEYQSATPGAQPAVLCHPAWQGRAERVQGHRAGQGQDERGPAEVEGQPAGQGDEEKVRRRVLPG